MLKRTHLAIGLAVGLYFIPLVNHEWIFLPVVLVTSLLPDIDSGFSAIGKKPIFKPIQMMSEHRGIFHTYTLCIVVTIFLTFIEPVFALPFFLGYSFHLFADSFTERGIRPFWPLKGVSKGMITTGGKSDTLIFIVFAMIDVFLLIIMVINF